LQKRPIALTRAIFAKTAHRFNPCDFCKNGPQFRLKFAYIIRFPNRVARRANVHIFEIVVVVSFVDDFRRGRAGVRRTQVIRTFHAINPRQRRIHFRKGIHHVLVLVLALFQTRLENAHGLLAQQLVHVTTPPTFVRQLVGVALVQRHVVHVVALAAKFHPTYVPTEVGGFTKDGCDFFLVDFPRV
jgi:hypothetical protein